MHTTHQHPSTLNPVLSLNPLLEGVCGLQSTNCISNKSDENSTRAMMLQYAADCCLERSRTTITCNIFLLFENRGSPLGCFYQRFLHNSSQLSSQVVPKEVHESKLSQRFSCVCFGVEEMAAASVWLAEWRIVCREVKITARRSWLILKGFLIKVQKWK